MEKSGIFKIRSVVWDFYLGCKVETVRYYKNNELFKEDITTSCPEPVEAKWTI